MALQLVYTSAPKLLDAGRSGFGVVARSKSLPPLAANAIERFSKYANMQGTDRSRIVMAHRKVTIGSSRLHVLSRIRDSGSDHTGRTNHIAHHLIFSPLEIRQAIAQRLTPADVFAQFTWLDRWEGAPKAYDSSADVHIGNFLPNYSATRRAAWTAATGEPLHARLLAWDGAPKSGSLIFPAGIGTLPLLGEALAECQNPWEKTFTTSLEPTDELAELDWVLASQSDASAISRVSSRTVFDISRPLDLPVPTEAPLPKPDVRATSHNEPGAAAGQEVGASAHQERVLPPPDQSRRPIQVRTISGKAGGRVPRDNRPIPATAQSAGNGKLWLIIGGGVAALFVLIATVLFLVQMGKPKPVENEQAAEAASKEKELATLVDRLIKVGEPKANAESIAELNVDKQVLKALPNQMQRLKERLKSLGKKEVPPKEMGKELETFIKNTKDIQELAVFPEGSLCYSLWESLSLIKKLKSKEGSSPDGRPVSGLLVDLKKSLKMAARITDPVWLTEEEIQQIYLLLWEWKYQNFVANLLNGKNSVTVQQIQAFFDARDIASVSDEKIEGIHKRMSEEKLKTYKEKLEAENPDLLAKFILADPKAANQDKTAGIDKPKGKPKPTVQVMPKLVNEEWCYANFKNEGNEFSVTLPDSKILTEIAKEKKIEGVEISFNGTEMVKLEELFGQGIDFKFNKNNIKFTREKASINISSPLKIVFKGSELKIHFNKWPTDKIKANTLTGRFERIPKADGSKASYRLYVDGPGLSEIADLRVNTILGADLHWAFLSQKVPKLTHEIKGTIATGENTIVIENFEPGGKEINDPTKENLDAFKKAIEITKNEVGQKLGKKGNEISDNKVRRIHEKAWKEKGLHHLQYKSNESLKWFSKKMEIESKGVSDPHDIKRISGGKLDDTSALGLKILSNPKGEFFQPKTPSTIRLALKSDSDFVFTSDFTIKVTK